ncbi:hypothetical protein [Arthrobacter rhombi]|uniref:hypothetical protein n=1 Tax=Arthrobacter rhombi TaxID=71253 RepID=UPI003FD15066
MLHRKSGASPRMSPWPEERGLRTDIPEQPAGNDGTGDDKDLPSSQGTPGAGHRRTVELASAGVLGANGGIVSMVAPTVGVAVATGTMALVITAGVAIGGAKTLEAMTDSKWVGILHA